MPNLVTAADVKLILETTLDDTIVESFINTAHVLVERIIASGAGLSADTLTQIELYLSAHFASIARERQTESERVEEWTVKFQGKTEMALDATLYGQTAKLLDTSGTLANLGKPRAKFKVFVTSNRDRLSR